MKNMLKIFAVLFLTLNIMPVLAVDDSDASSQSKANRLLTSASSVATGVGGMELTQGLAEQKADRTAEQSMSAYISTMRCSYGNGKSVKAGTEEIELPGGNNANMMKYRTEYTALAADLKERKNALDMTPGIESEEILDKSQMGLYDDENVGINGGRYASLYRAQMLGSESDQAQLDEAKQTSKTRVIGGAVAAGVGVVGGIVGDELINQSLSSSTKTAQTCTESGGTWQGARCHCPDGFIQRTKTGPCFEEKPTKVQTTTPPQRNNPVLSSNGSGNNGSDGNGGDGNGQSGGTSDADNGAGGSDEKGDSSIVDIADISFEEYEFESAEFDETADVAVIEYEKSEMCRKFDGNWQNGKCLCTNSFTSNQYIECVQDTNAPTVTTNAPVVATASTAVVATTATNSGTNIDGTSSSTATSTTRSNNSQQKSGDDNTVAVATQPSETQQSNSGNSETTVTTSQTEATCGVVGKKECNSNYYVCASNSDCTPDKLPANATAGHCWKSGSRSVCTATACKDSFEPTSGYCKKREVADRNTNAQKTNTSTTQRPNYATKSTQQNTNSNAVVGYNADGSCDIYKDEKRQEANVESCSGLSKNQWRSNGKQGISRCASNSNAFGKTAPEGDTGRDCWCKINNKNNWVYIGGYTYQIDCPANCAYNCAYEYHKNKKQFQ